MNRVMVGSMSDLNFAPTDQAYENLKNENKVENSIVITGNTAIDAMKTTIKDDYYSDILERHNGKNNIINCTQKRKYW